MSYKRQLCVSVRGFTTRNTNPSPTCITLDNVGLKGRSIHNKFDGIISRFIRIFLFYIYRIQPKMKQCWNEAYCAIIFGNFTWQCCQHRLHRARDETSALTLLEQIYLHSDLLLFVLLLAGLCSSRAREISEENWLRICHLVA